MQALFEALPFVIGIPSTFLYRLTRPFPFKKTSLFILALLAGILANRLSGEGTDLLPVDLLQACGSTLICLLLSRPLIKQHA